MIMSLVIFFIIWQFITGDAALRGGMLRGLLLLIFLPTIIRLVVLVGLQIIPLVLIGLFIVNIAVPFIRGFLSRF